MENYDNAGDKFEVNPEARETLVTLDDLLSSNSDVLNRIARNIENANETTAHSSQVSGHSSSGSHNSHSSSQIEQPLV